MSENNPSLKQVVADYLRKHPDFFVEFPDILQNIELNHSSGAAVSLIERQVESLRKNNSELERQLMQLVQVASENEELMSRLHHLSVKLLQMDSGKAFFTHLGNALLNDFNADILQICLFDANQALDAGEDVRAIHRDDREIEPFLRHLDKHETVCGRLGANKTEFLFGSKARWVQSAALVPLGKNGCHGMMAIGSSDESRFYPGMGTLFLDLLANVISAHIDSAKPQEQLRSA